MEWGVRTRTRSSEAEAGARTGQEVVGSVDIVAHTREEHTSWHITTQSCFKRTREFPPHDSTAAPDDTNKRHEIVNACHKHQDRRAITAAIEAHTQVEAQTSAATAPQAHTHAPL